MSQETIKDETPTQRGVDAATPGVVIVWSGATAAFEALPLRRGRLELGRDELAALGLDDGRVSRQHLALALDGGAWTITDRGSTNGVFVDGVALHGAARRPAPRVLRIGRTLLAPAADITPLAVHGMSVNPQEIIGPRLRAVLDQVTAIGRVGQSLLITGPSGAGKELAARRYHDAGAHGCVCSARHACVRGHDGA